MGTQPGMLGLGESFSQFTQRTEVAPEEALAVYTGALGQLNKALRDGESLNDFTERTGVEEVDEILPAYNTFLMGHRSRLAAERGVLVESLRV